MSFNHLKCQLATIRTKWMLHACFAIEAATRTFSASPCLPAHPPQGLQNSCQHGKPLSKSQTPMCSMETCAEACHTFSSPTHIVHEGTGHKTSSHHISLLSKIGRGRPHWRCLWTSRKDCGWKSCEILKFLLKLLHPFPSVGQLGWSAAPQNCRVPNGGTNDTLTILLCKRLLDSEEQRALYHALLLLLKGPPKRVKASEKSDAHSHTPAISMITQNWPPHTRYNVWQNAPTA